jgi:hypothetical protein
VGTKTTQAAKTVPGKQPAIKSANQATRKTALK